VTGAGSVALVKILQIANEQKWQNPRFLKKSAFSANFLEPKNFESMSKIIYFVKMSDSGSIEQGLCSV